jgi:hypothetical protein
MGRLKEFVSKGVRLIVTDTDDPGAPVRIPPPHRTAGRMDDLDAMIADTEPAAAAPPVPAPVSQVPADVVDFAAVYDEAGITTPAHGYGIDKVAEMLESKRLAPLAREVKSAAVMAALEAAGVALKDVIRDGMLRDQALDAFEAAKDREARELRVKNETRIAEVREEIEAYLRLKNTEIEALRHAADQAAKSFLELQTRKRREEERLHDVVAQFVEPSENPITTGAHPAPAPPAGPTRE